MVKDTCLIGHKRKYRSPRKLDLESLHMLALEGDHLAQGHTSTQSIKMQQTYIMNA
jgi:hypothetical protein